MIVPVFFRSTKTNGNGSPYLLFLKYPIIDGDRRSLTQLNVKPKTSRLDIELNRNGWTNSNGIRCQQQIFYLRKVKRSPILYITYPFTVDSGGDGGNLETFTVIRDVMGVLVSRLKIK